MSHFVWFTVYIYFQVVIDTECSSPRWL